MSEPVTPTTPPGPASRTRAVLAAVAALVVVAIAAAVLLLNRPTDPGPTAAASASAAPSSSATTPSAGPGASSAPSATPGASSAPSPSAAPGVTAEPNPADAPRLGRDDAKVEVTYWADYQCPFCAAFAQDVIPELQPLIDDGTIALVHRDYAFLGPESVDAAIAVRCADDYWAMHDAVYAAQSGENQGAFYRANLLEIADSIGEKDAEFEACLDDRSKLIAVLDDTASAIRQSVDSTPTIEVNGTRFNGVPPVAELRAAIDAAVAGAPPEPPPARREIEDPWAELPVDGRTVGDPDAPVTVDLWVDYQGLNGPVLARELAPELRTRVAAGDVRLVLHDLALLGQESVFASSTVRCIEAQGGPHWLVSDVLASAGRGPDNQVFRPDTLLKLASQLGLDVKSFDLCMQDPATLAMIDEDTQAGRAIGLQSGPAVVIVSGGIEAARFEGSLAASSVLAAIDEATP